MKSTFAFGIGAVIGAGLAIYFAPKIGKQIREGLKEVAGSIERGQAKVREITTEAIRVADQVQRVQDAVDAGVRAFKEVTNFTNRSSS